MACSCSKGMGRVTKKAKREPRAARDCMGLTKKGKLKRGYRWVDAADRRDPYKCPVRVRRGGAA